MINNIEDPYNLSVSSNEPSRMEQRKRMIKEALERIKKKRLRMQNQKKEIEIETSGEGGVRFRPVPVIQKGPGDR